MPYRPARVGALPQIPNGIYQFTMVCRDDDGMTVTETKSVQLFTVQRGALAGTRIWRFQESESGDHGGWSGFGTLNEDGSLYIWRSHRQQWEGTMFARVLDRICAGILARRTIALGMSASDLALVSGIHVTHTLPDGRLTSVRVDVRLLSHVCQECNAGPSQQHGAGCSQRYVPPAPMRQPVLLRDDDGVPVLVDPVFGAAPPTPRTDAGEPPRRSASSTRPRVTRRTPPARAIVVVMSDINQEEIK